MITPIMITLIIVITEHSQLVAERSGVAFTSR